MASRPRKRRHHDEPDWDAIHAGYLAGRKPQDLARTFGATPNAISTRASRDGWCKDRQAVARKIAEEMPGVVVAATLDEIERRTREQLADASELRTLARVVRASVTNASDVAALVKAARGLADLERLALNVPAPGAKAGGVNADAPAVATVPDYSDLADVSTGELRRRLDAALGRGAGGGS